MDTYPAFDQHEGTKPRPRSGVMIRTATNGKSRARALTSETRFDPTLVHLQMTEAQVATLRAFHESHRGIPFNVEFWPGSETITCLFLDPPFDIAPAPAVGGMRYRVQVNLIRQD